MFFIGKNRKKNLILSFLALFLFSGVIFAFSDVQPAHAWESRLKCVPGAGFMDCWNSGGDVSNAGDNFIVTGFKWFLYAIFTVFGVMASLAVTIFEWAIKPDNVQLLFNSPGVYESWKFIRDFFNLFFILILLYIAFMVIFQIDKNFKKTLLSLVLAALYINFSFPVSRALIDVTNVPMYFFSNQMMAISGGGTDLFGNTMTASNIKGILVPGAQDGGKFDSSTVDVPRLLIAIIFIFIFSITLLVLSVMFVIRLVALVILVIFSSVGFAASVVPGLSSYSKMWWESFWKYAFFGPAAMLMLLVATRFFSSLSDGAIMKSMQTVATGSAAGVDQTFFSSMALFSIPIIMLWMAMGLAHTFSLAGASSVVGQGKKFSAWAGKKTMNGGKWATYRNPVARGVVGGMKDRFDNNKLTKFFKSPSKTEARIKGALGTGTVQKELDAIHQKAAYEEAEKMKKANISNPDLKSALHGNDKVASTAAAMLLSERKAIDTSDDFTKALEVLGNNTKEVATLIGNASGDALKADTSTPAGADRYGKLVTSGAFATNPKLKEQLEGKMKKEGHAKVLIDYEINKTAGAMPRQAAYDKYLGKMTAEEVGKTKNIHGDMTHPADAELIAFIQNQTRHTNNWTPKEHIDAYSKLNSEQKSAWAAAGINP